MAGNYNAKNQRDYEASLSETAKIRRRNLKSFSASKSFIRLHANKDQLHDIINLAKEVLEGKNES